jgi:hypothetical protein
MRDECERVASSLHGTAPSIVPGAQTSSGAGVGSAVFPPVDQTGQPPQGSVQTPYQPGAYGPPTPAPQTPSYGYPQQGGYQTPAPGTAAYAPQQGMATPPPYNITPQAGTTGGGSQGGGKSSKGVVIGSIVVSLVAVGGLIAALIMNGGGDDEAGGGTSPSPSQSSTKAEGYRGPDTTKTIETTECTEPTESYDDPDKVLMPNFTFKNWDSVLSCLQAAGWNYDKVSVDENVYGEDTVMRQSPKEGTDIDPDDPPTIQFDISTGNPS